MKEKMKENFKRKLTNEKKQQKPSFSLNVIFSFLSYKKRRRRLMLIMIKIKIKINEAEESVDTIML